MNSFDLHLSAEAARPEGAEASILIEVYFDFICPWCLIGKRNLDTAVSRLVALSRA
jgi:predicted DsbA family dithiol-disulfide isomerase